jgi:hypothetical protein
MNTDQLAVVNHIINGQNVIVNAVAGSGKSTTVLSVAKATQSLKTIQFTYNSMLRMEIKQKIKTQNITNLDVHTYHSMAVKYYDSTAYTDTGIRHILAKDLKPRTPLPKMDIIVLDETQDMTFLYYNLVLKFTMDMDHDFQLLVLGDFMQGIYEFKGADTRFLTLADHFWRNHPRLKSASSPFHHCSLSTSYRITDQMREFINEALLGEIRLLSCRAGNVPVYYLRNTRRNMENMVVYHIKKLLSEGASPSDFFILGASVKGPNSQIRKIENVLVSHGIPCHVPMFDTDTIDDKIIQNKVVFCTFHSVKGRERKYVFVTGFDQGYMSFYCKDLPQDRCPNTIYVAVTRATEGLFLLERSEFDTDKPMKFMKKTHFEIKKMDCVEFKGMPYYQVYDIPEKKNEDGIKHYVTPTDLIKFIPEQVLEEITPYLKTMFRVVQPKAMEINIPSVIETEQGYFEEISDLNGLAIPALYCDYLSSLWEEDGGTNVLYQTVLLILDELKEHEHKYLKEAASRLPAKFTKPSDYLFLANVYTAFQEKLYFKLKQIGDHEYNWITDEVLERSKNRLENTIGQECKEHKPLIEKTIIHSSQELEHEVIDNYLEEYFEEGVHFRFTARTDLITAKTVWEIKCVKELTMDHQLQVIIYAWLYRMLGYPRKSFKLFNIRTNEVQELNATREEIDFVMISLLQGKYQKMEKKSDEDFLNDANLLFTMYNKNK